MRDTMRIMRVLNALASAVASAHAVNAEAVIPPLHRPMTADTILFTLSTWWILNFQVRQTVLTCMFIHHLPALATRDSTAFLAAAASTQVAQAAASCECFHFIACRAIKNMVRWNADQLRMPVASREFAMRSTVRTSCALRVPLHT